MYTELTRFHCGQPPRARSIPSHHADHRLTSCHAPWFLKLSNVPGVRAACRKWPGLPWVPVPGPCPGAAWLVLVSMRTCVQGVSARGQLNTALQRHWRGLFSWVQSYWREEGNTLCWWPENPRFLLQMANQVCKTWPKGKLTLKPAALEDERLNEWIQTGLSMTQSRGHRAAIKQWWHSITLSCFFEGLVLYICLSFSIFAYVLMGFECSPYPGSSSSWCGSSM